MDLTNLDLQTTFKTIFIKSFFKTFMKTGFLGLGESEKTSDKYIDGERLAEDVNEALAQLEKYDYEILNITPIISGNYLMAQTGGAGYSFTDGLMITAKKK